MRKISLLIFIFLLSSQTLSAQDVGSGAAASSDMSTSTSWKNWVFASTALVSVAIGVLVVALNPGSNAH